MSIDRFIGSATVVYVCTVTIAALWWASDLSRRVQTIEGSTVTAERLVRLETEVRNLSDTTQDLKVSINELVYRTDRTK